MNQSEIKSLHNLPKRSYLNYISLFPVTQTEQIKTYTTLILTLIAVIGFSIFAISPTINTILELRRQLADSQFANTALEEKIASLESLQAQYTGFGTKLERINETFPTTPEVPDLFARIQTLARENGVQVMALESQEVELTKNTKSQVPSSFVFLVTTEGSYEQNISFLNELTDFNRILTIDTITMTRETAASGPLEMTIRARSYFHPEGGV